MQSGDKDNEDGWLACLEEQYLQAIGAEPDYERQYITEREQTISNTWGNFQESATSIAQLYKGKSILFIFLCTNGFSIFGRFVMEEKKKMVKDKAKFDLLCQTFCIGFYIFFTICIKLQH